MTPTSAPRRARRRRRGRAAAAVLPLIGAAVLGTLGLVACSGKKAAVSESVFSVKPGQCFQAPGTVKAELSDLSRTACSVAHTQEAYAIVGFTNSDGSAASAYPGDSALTTFAQGACAQQFTTYVGVDYLDSSLFFTYLLPSARSWEQSDDHDVVCFITTTGAPLTASVKGSKK